MNFPVLTCAQCGSSDVKLMSQRNDLVNCNHCGAIFMIPSPQATVVPEVTEEEEEEEELLIPPVPKKPTGFSGIEKVVVTIIGFGAIYGVYLILNLNGEDSQMYQLFGCIGVVGICSMILVWAKDRKNRDYVNSEEMKEYNRIRRLVREKREEKEMRKTKRSADK